MVNGNLERVPGDGWQEALDLYQAQRDDLFAGRTPRPTAAPAGPTLADLCKSFLSAKPRRLESGELTRRTFDDYAAVAKRMVAEFGRNRPIADIAADDFARLRDGMAKQWGPMRLGTQIQMVRTFFKFGYDAALIDRPGGSARSSRSPPRASCAPTGRSAAKG